MNPPYLGLHSPIYVSRTELNNILADVGRLKIHLSLDPGGASPLEVLALWVLKENGYLTKTETDV